MRKALLTFLISMSGVLPIHAATIFFTQIGATRTNGRPKGRAFLDFLRVHFKGQGPPEPAGAPLVIVP